MLNAVSLKLNGVVTLPAFSIVMNHLTSLKDEPFNYPHIMPYRMSFDDKTDQVL